MFFHKIHCTASIINGFSIINQHCFVHSDVLVGDNVDDDDADDDVGGDQMMINAKHTISWQTPTHPILIFFGLFCFLLLELSTKGIFEMWH